MIVKMSLYKLESSGLEFRSKLSGVLYYLGCMPTKDYPDVCIKPVEKPDGSQYYQIVLCYVEDVLAISDNLIKTIDGIKSVFKLKGDKVYIPDMYLGTTIQTAETADGTACWTMSSEKYVRAALENDELKLSKSNHRLTLRCDTPMSTSYHPNEDISKEMNAQGYKHINN